MMYNNCMETKTNINLAIPVKQKDILTNMADMYNLSVTQLINQMIKDYIIRENEKLIIQLYAAGNLILKGDE